MEYYQQCERYGVALLEEVSTILRWLLPYMLFDLSPRLALEVFLTRSYECYECRYVLYGLRWVLTCQAVILGQVSQTVLGIDVVVEPLVDEPSPVNLGCQQLLQLIIRGDQIIDVVR